MTIIRTVCIGEAWWRVMVRTIDYIGGNVVLLLAKNMKRAVI